VHLDEPKAIEIVQSPILMFLAERKVRAGRPAFSLILRKVYTSDCSPARSLGLERIRHPQEKLEVHLHSGHDKFECLVSVLDAAAGPVIVLQNIGVRFKPNTLLLDFAKLTLP
jgi:hypothetical protein